MYILENDTELASYIDRMDSEDLSLTANQFVDLVDCLDQRTEVSISYLLNRYGVNIHQLSFLEKIGVVEIINSCPIFRDDASDGALPTIFEKPLTVKLGSKGQTIINSRKSSTCAMPRDV